MTFLEAIRLKALYAVQHPDRQYFIRTVIRWYSKTFHTPIQAVEELLLEEVLQTYYEEQYRDLPPEELEKEIKELTLDPEEQIKQKLLEDQEEAEIWEIGQMIAKEQREHELKAAQPKDPIRAEEQRQKLIRDVDSDLPSSEGIHMDFVTDDEIANDFESDPLGG